MTPSPDLDLDALVALAEQLVDDTPVGWDAYHQTSDDFQAVATPEVVLALVGRLREAEARIHDLDSEITRLLNEALSQSHRAEAAEARAVPEGWTWRWCDCARSEYGPVQHPVFAPSGPNANALVPDTEEPA